MAKSAQAVEEKQDEQNATAQADSKKHVQSIEFPEASEGARSSPGGHLNILLDMSVPITVAIGQTEVPVRRLLQLGPGSVLKLAKPIDEPADLYLKDVKFATGDIVVVDGRFGVRIRHIIGLDDSGTEAAQM